MPYKCPKCNSTIDSVKVYTKEENYQRAQLTQSGGVIYDAKEPVESSADWTDIVCPVCDKTIIRMSGDGSDEEIIKAVSSFFG